MLICDIKSLYENAIFLISTIHKVLINPNDTDVFFDACVPGGGPVGPELENRFLH